ncbi:MAG: hypothetical protein Q4G68_09825 [Planctomycetia bacterium]|nr:hypothetical protein [Planctomycetia bacterium]
MKTTHHSHNTFFSRLWSLGRFSAHKRRNRNGVCMQHGCDYAGNRTYPEDSATTRLGQVFDEYYTHDARGRFTSVNDNAASYQYNSQNHNVKKTLGVTVTRHFFNENGRELESYEDLSSIPEMVDLCGNRSRNLLVCRNRDTNNGGTLDERLYSLAGPNRNVFNLTDSDGVVQDRYNYNAFVPPTHSQAASQQQEPQVPMPGRASSSVRATIAKLALCSTETGIIIQTSGGLYGIFKLDIYVFGDGNSNPFRYIQEILMT